MQQKIIRQYYILSCLFNIGGISLISAIYATYLIRNGLGLFEINMVNATFFLTLFVCEIPTGAFADIFGRKTSFIAACGIMCASMILYGCSHTLAGFVAAEILGGIGVTFENGAFDSWLVDNLKHHGYEGDCKRIFGRSTSICQLGGGVGAIVGSWLTARNPSLPWLFGGIAMAGTGILSYVIMKEEYFVRRQFSFTKGLSSMRTIALSSIKYGTNDAVVRFILVITFVQICAVMALNMYWQPFFKDKGFSEQNLGFIFFGIMFAVAGGSMVVSRLDCEGKEKMMLIRTQIFAGVLIIVLSLVHSIPMMAVLFLAHEVPRGYWRPLTASYLHKRIPSEERATIASFCSIAPHIGGAIGLVASGIIAKYSSINAAWIVSGAVLVVGAMWLGKNSNGKEGQEKVNET